LWRRRERKTLRGKVINRMRVALRDCLKGWNIGTLPYSRNDLVQHIENELHRYNYRCALCNSDLRIAFDIDHRTPLRSATTAEDTLALFALENLSVLCPACNQKKKRGQLIDY
jgi:5-methylcytosine-specific restriction endonuclease McrA